MKYPSTAYRLKYEHAIRTYILPFNCWTINGIRGVDISERCGTAGSFLSGAAFGVRAILFMRIFPGVYKIIGNCSIVEAYRVTVFS